MNKEDLKLILEAKNCNSCLCWLSICKAECCKGFYLKVPDSSKVKAGMQLISKNNKNVELTKNYYKLHGVKITREYKQFVIDEFDIVSETEIFIKQPCCKLTEHNTCKIHEDKNRPILCKQLSMDNYHDLKGVKVTPNCLIKYKLMGEDKWVG